MAEQGLSGAEQKDDVDSQHSPEKRKQSPETARDRAPPEKKKFCMGISIAKNRDSKKSRAPVDTVNKKPIAPVKLALTSQKKDAPVAIVKKNSVVAAVFNDDEDSEEEEMPAAAKMRMKNIGSFGRICRIYCPCELYDKDMVGDTPTAAGPNSFGKGKLGFSDRQSLYEKELKKAMDDVAPD